MVNSIPGLVKCVIFDCEGVVIDTEPLWDEAQADFLARFGVRYDRPTVKPLLAGRSLMDGTATLKELYDLPESLRELARMRARLLWQHLLYAGFVQGFREFYEWVRAWAATGLASSIEAELFDLVDRRLRIRECFSGHVYLSSVLNCAPKPAPDIFLQAAESIGIQARRCVVVEDSPSGITAARQAGMSTIGLCGTFEGESLSAADWVVSSYADIQAIVERLVGARGQS
jgi:beta-phosphoglucomutase-like phosphatase (HAD superfamily)